MYNIIKRIILIVVCHILFRVKCEDIDVLCKYDKCIICPNHSRIYDPIFLFDKVDNMYSMAKSELFKHKIIGDFLRSYNVFPINREKADIGGVKKAISLLNQNDKIKLLIFPEGKVLKSKQNRGNVKNGAVYIASVNEIPIIPVCITARPRYFSKVTIKFGKPFFPNKSSIKDKEKLKSESAQLLKLIYALEDE